MLMKKVQHCRISISKTSLKEKLSNKCASIFNYLIQKDIGIKKN